MTRRLSRRAYLAVLAALADAWTVGDVPGLNPSAYGDTLAALFRPR